MALSEAALNVVKNESTYIAMYLIDVQNFQDNLKMLSGMKDKMNAGMANAGLPNMPSMPSVFKKFAKIQKT